ncbi:hypothetical protein D3C77_409690 [compost metagenome]
MQNFVREALGLFAEYEEIAVPVFEIGIALLRFCRRKEKAAAAVFLFNLPERIMVFNIYRIPVIKPCALQCGIVRTEAKRAYQMQMNARSCTGTGNISRICGYFRFNKYNMQRHNSQILTNYKFELIQIHSSHSRFFPCLFYPIPSLLRFHRLFYLSIIAAKQYSPNKNLPPTLLARGILYSAGKSVMISFQDTPRWSPQLFYTQCINQFPLLIRWIFGTLP